MKSALFFLFLVLSCFFAGCISDSSGIEEATSNPSRELVIPLGDKEITMDPFGTSTSWHIRPLVFETLVVADIEGNHPALATSWDVSKDGMTWTFHLHEGVKFHDNTPFDAFTVNYSVYKSMEKPYRFKVESTQIPDDHTFIITLKENSKRRLAQVLLSRLHIPNRKLCSNRIQNTGMVLPKSKR